MYIASFKDLIVWQRSIQAEKAVYAASEQLPKNERFVLVQHMRKSAISVSSNIAEGKKRKGKKDFVRFLRIAYGSAAELDTQIVIAQELYPAISFGTAARLTQEVQKMLAVMIQRLEN